MSVTVRRATETDLLALHALLSEYAREGHLQSIEDRAALREYVANPPFGFQLAESGNAVIACVLLRRLNSIPSAAECKRLYVLPAHRGRRIANLLMDAVETQARSAGLHWLYLDSKDDFQTAIALYRRRGYRECAKFNDNPQATIFLRKQLQ